MSSADYGLIKIGIETSIIRQKLINSLSEPKTSNIHSPFSWRTKSFLVDKNNRRQGASSESFRIYPWKIDTTAPLNSLIAIKGCMMM
jgi:hypothetical protein